MDRQAEKDKTERVTELGRRTRKEIAKWNQMTALRFQTGGGEGGEEEKETITAKHKQTEAQATFLGFFFFF